jgi:hypothetical protein
MFGTASLLNDDEEGVHCPSIARISGFNEALIVRFRTASGAECHEYERRQNEFHGCALTLELSGRC